ncbi:MAG: hypothetical protein R3Y46_01080 [Opitutales bacterium]
MSLGLYFVMDWQIRSISKKSDMSGTELREGDVVISAIFVDDGSNLDRIDVLKSEFDANNFPQKILGMWERTLSNGEDYDEKLSKKLALASSEDFFLSMFQENTTQVQERDILKMLLALLLERKRVLRALGRPVRGVQKYLHIATKKEFEVEQLEISLELIIKIQSQLDALII